MARSHSSRATRRAEASLTEVSIPNKVYFRIGEVGELTQTKPYVLRYWETEFPSLKPTKTRSGHRLYRRQDVETVFAIKRLLYEQGFTIEGARKQLASNSAGGSVNSAEQNPLFRSSLDGNEVKAIQRELRTILTMLSRKC